MNRRRPLMVAALIALVVLLPPLILPAYSLSIAGRILIFALLAVSLDLIYGYGGMASLGQAAYFGMGGYAVAILMLKADITSAWILVPAGVAAGAGAAALLGLIALRTKGLNFLLVTFGLGQLLATIAVQWSWLHSFGVEGLVGISMPDIGVPIVWDATTTYYAVAVAAIVGYGVAYYVTRSPLGHAIRGIREDERRMQTFGFNTWWCRYKMFIIAGGLAALSGQLFAFTSGTVLPTYLDFTYSALAFLLVVMGGAGTLYGPACAAVVIVLLEYEVSDRIPDRWPLVLGAVFVITAVISRHGLVGMVRSLVAAIRRRQTSTARRQTPTAPEGA